MTPTPSAAWRRLEPLLDELLDLEPDARAARLAALAAKDPGTHAELVKLLAGAESEAPLGRPVGEVGALLFSAEPAQPSRQGERVGVFEITGELGRGGMGTVYAARRVEGGFEQEVAIKVVKGGFDSEEVLRRFLAERRILARLAHPHIARLIDGGVTGDGLPWFAMERVDGVPLTAFATRERLATPRRLEFLLDVWQLGRLLGELLERPLPRDLERIVARTCHEEPERRYASAEALAEDVRRFLDGRAVEARGDSRPDTTWAIACRGAAFTVAPQALLAVDRPPLARRGRGRVTLLGRPRGAARRGEARAR